MIQIVIDSCCATFAEVQKRGKDFWAEFELYVADLLVGVVVNVALVGMLAPYARIGGPSVSKGFLGRMQHAYGALPSRLLAHAKGVFLSSDKEKCSTIFLIKKCFNFLVLDVAFVVIIELSIMPLSCILNTYSHLFCLKYIFNFRI